MDLSEIWIVEYSRSQRCFHVETLDEAVKANLYIAERGLKADYIPVAACRSHGAAVEASEALRALLSAKPRARVIFLLRRRAQLFLERVKLWKHTEKQP